MTSKYNELNIWLNFYNSIKDPSWPDCVNCYEFHDLPANIQEEILQVFGGEKFLKLNKNNIKICEYIDSFD